MNEVQVTNTGFALRIFDVGLLVLMAAAGGGVLTRAIYFAWHYCTVTPYWDFWNWLSDYQNYVAGHFTLHDLVKPHNEHRIVTTRLVLLIDAICFHMRGHFACLTNIALLALAGAMLGCLNVRSKTGAAVSAATGLLVIGIMTSLCQWQNLILPFQVGHAFLGVFLVGAAFSGVMGTRPSPPGGADYFWAGLAGACFFSGAFSLAGGLLTAPWLLLIFVLRRARVGPTLLFAAIVAVTAILFFVGYQPGPAQPLTFGVDWAARATIMVFAAGFLGSPLYPYPLAPFIAGFAGMFIVTCSALLIFWWRFVSRLPLPGRMVALLAISGSIAGMAGAAAVSRASSGLAEALQPRYATIALVFWCSLIPLFFQVLQFATAKRRYALELITSKLYPLILLGLLVAVNLSARYRQDARQFAELMSSQAESIRQNVFVPELFRIMFYGGVDDASSRLAFLRAQHLAVFATANAPPLATIERAAHAATAKDLPTCLGRIDFAYRQDSTRSVVRGWLGSSSLKAPPEWVALFAPTGSGFVLIPTTESRGKIRIGRVKIPAMKGIYSGYSDPEAGQPGSGAVRAVAIFNNAPGALCQYDMRLSDIRVQSISSISSVQPLLLRQQASLGAFVSNGASAVANLTAPFPGEPLFASSAAGGQATGRAMFTVVPDPNIDVVIPFATGPSVQGLSIEAAFADGTRTHIDIPADVGAAQWRAATISHSDAAQHGGIATISAIEEGSGLDEWMVVGSPMATKLNLAWAKLY